MSPRLVPNPGPPTLRDRIREATTEAILSAAEGVFAEHGLHKAHVNEIAARAGVSVGTLYNYFKDREAILVALLNARHDDLMTRLDEVLKDGAAGPFREQLQRLLTTLINHFHSHERFFAILSQGELVQGMPACTRPIATLMEVYQRVSAVMSRGVQEGALRPEDGALYPTLLMGMMRGVMMRRRFEDERRRHSLDVAPGATGPAQAEGDTGADTEADEVVDLPERLVRFFLEGAGLP